MIKIHPSSVVDPHAELGENVDVGPYCTIGPNVKIGDDTRLISHVVIDGYTTIGKRNLVFPFASLGLIAQHKRSNAPDAVLIVGDDNTFREQVTAHVGSEVDNKITKIGNRNLFLVGSHIAHDCIVGDDVIMSNNAALAGHVQVGNRAIIGGLSAVLQFTHIGEGAMIGGMVGVKRDVIPYGIVAGGERNGLAGLNLVGLQRAGVAKEDIMMLQKAYKTLFDKDSGLIFSDRIALLESDDALKSHPMVQKIVEFVKNPSRNNILQPE